MPPPSLRPLRRRQRRAPSRSGRHGLTARAVLSGATILVASYLVNAPTALAAPSPLQTQLPAYAPSSPRSSPLFAYDGSRPTRQRSAMMSVMSSDANRADHNVVDDAFGPTEDELLFVESDWRSREAQSPKSLPTTTAHPKIKRDLSLAAVNGTSRSISVPASFTSNLANAWDPGRRSVWFQRKAVIITAVFLAIFIVLIIGATVFLRDKREDDLEEEYDVSDEAALARMREEREMRLGSRGEKKPRRFRKKKDDSSSTRSGENGTSTAIAASKWARIPTRKIRIRKSNSKDSSLAEKTRSATDTTPADSTRTADNGSSRSHSAAAHDADSAQRTPGIDEMPPPLSPFDGEAPFGGNGEQPTQVGPTGDRGSPSSSARGRVPLTAADFEFADEEAERIQMGDTLPPAYIPSQRRGSAQRGSAGSSAVRQLAGQQSPAEMAEARGDSKRPLADLDQEQAERYDASSSAAATAAATSSRSGDGLQQPDYEAHIATDEKTLLSRMRQAASHPAAASPAYGSSTPVNAPAASGSPPQATAPVLEEDAAAFEHLTSSDEPYVPFSSSKGKSTPHIDSRLPAPPSASANVAFSHFDMPYERDLNANARQAQGPLYEAHVATDDKKLLGHILQSSSHPASAPAYGPSSPFGATAEASASDSSFVATAPAMENTGEDDVGAVAASAPVMDDMEEDEGAAHLPTSEEPSAPVTTSEAESALQHAVDP